MVTVLPQGNIKLHFELLFTAFFNGGCLGVGTLQSFGNRWDLLCQAEV
jgi:hypothetical protein